jgi:hypothetical protein
VGLDAQVLGYKLGAGAGTTAGQAAQKLYSCSGASGDVEQTTAASQPLLLVHSGANYWFGSGVAGNDVSAGVIAPVATLELDVKVQLNGGNALPARTIIAQDSGSGGNRIFSLEFANATTGTLALFYNSGFAGYQVSSAGIGIIDNYSGWVRATYLSNGTTATITFYSSTNGTTWNMLSTHSGLISTGLGTSNSSLRVGSNNGGNLYQGRILYASISNVIDGTPTRIFNPNQYNPSTSQTQWTSSTGEVWTINTGTAATGYKGVLVDRTEVQGDGIDDKLTASGLSAITLNTRISALNPINLSGGYIIQGRQSGTGDKHLWYQTGGNIQAYTNAGGSINFGGISANSLKVLSTDFNTTSSNCLTNNANQVNGTLNSDAFTDLDVFGGTASFKNCIINTLIETSSVSTSTQKTAMYNYIRSINNL